MAPSLRPFHPLDVQAVGQFLVEHYQPGNRDGNWLRPEWDYMHSHPNLAESFLNRIGVWEDRGKIAAVAHYESGLGEAFFQVHPEYTFLWQEMLAYAEENLNRTDDQGQRSLRIYIKNFNQDLERVARKRSFQPAGEHDRPMSLLSVPDQIDNPKLPEGYQLLSLADENDLSKIHRVMWRGFGHPGEPPQEGLEWRRKMQSSPNFQPELNLVVIEPGGNYVCYCGFWYESTNRYAIIEPLATDPDFRRKGLARAAVREGIRRCASLGAREIFVGSDQAFYQALGFATSYRTRTWIKTIT